MQYIVLSSSQQLLYTQINIYAIQTLVLYATFNLMKQV
jgi:hypothetical protein